MEFLNLNLEKYIIYILLQLALLILLFMVHMEQMRLYLGMVKMVELRL